MKEYSYCHPTQHALCLEVNPKWEGLALACWARGLMGGEIYSLRKEKKKVSFGWGRGETKAI